MPNSLKCKIKHLRHNGTLTERECDRILKALEQQPCEDCISRQAVLNTLDYIDKILNEDRTVEHYKEMLKECYEILPPVTSQQTSTLDKIKAEILYEAEYAYADFDGYKNDILHAEPDELPDDDFRYGLERAVEIINKYKAESEEEV